MRVTQLAAALMLTAAPLVCAVAATDTVIESEPGAVSIGQSTEVTGTITAIDAATREVTLALSDGETTVIECGPDVKNFAQLKVGDAVEMEFTQALAMELKKGSTAEVSRTVESAQASAKPGATPGGAAGTRVHVVAEVTAIDIETQTVTLRGPEHTIDLKVNDPKQFENIAVGDRIEATYVEAIAIAVTHAPPVD